MELINVDDLNRADCWVQKAQVLCSVLEDELGFDVVKVEEKHLYTFQYRHRELCHLYSLLFECLANADEIMMEALQPELEDCAGL